MLYRVVIALYGLINIAGGAMAYFSPNIKSIWSLVVGGTSGLLFLFFAYIAGKQPGFAFRAAAALCVAMAAFWVFRITELTGQGKSPMIAVMNLCLAIVVFATLGIGHMAGVKKNQG